MADTQVLEACASAWGFESPLPHQLFLRTRKQRGGFESPLPHQLFLRTRKQRGGSSPPPAPETI
jgi:hypothetical protein